MKEEHSYSYFPLKPNSPLYLANTFYSTMYTFPNAPLSMMVESGERMNSCSYQVIQTLHSLHII